jgi:hypothetical protein
VEPINAEMTALGVTPVVPPSVGASRLEALGGLWADAGLEAVETRVIAVQRTFDDFDDFWNVTTATGGQKLALATMEADAIARLKDRVRVRLPTDTEGRITYGAWANAVKGRVPKAR